MDIGPLALVGWGPAVEGEAAAYAPRHYLLDTMLVDAAREAGVEVREGFSLQELTREGERVTGIIGRNAGGATVREHARIVIGADGRHSRVAALVDAAEYHSRPALACYYYSYFRNTGVTQPRVLPA